MQKIAKSLCYRLYESLLLLAGSVYGSDKKNHPPNQIQLVTKKKQVKFPHI